MATLAPATELRRGNWARVVALQPLLVPLASLLVALTLLGAGARLLLVVALPALAIGAISHRLSRPSAAAVALLLGVLALGAGLIARSNLLIVAGVLYLLAGISRGWGVNRGRRRRRAWTNRLLAAVGRCSSASSSLFPTLLRRRLPRQASCTDRSGGAGVAARARHLPGGRRRSPGRLVCAFPQRRCDRARARRRRRPPGNDPPRTDAREGGLRRAPLRRARPRRERRTGERSRLAMGPRRTRGRLLPDKPRHRPHRPAWSVHWRRSGRHRGCVRQTCRSGRCGRPTGPHRRRRQPPSLRRSNLYRAQLRPRRHRDPARTRRSATETVDRCRCTR